MTMNADRDQGIDFLRGLSILGVLCYHYMLFRPASSYGLYGVLLFFVISGYCMSPSVSGCENVKQFLMKRVCRLLPALLICALVTAFIEMALPLIPDRSQSAMSLLKTLVCLPVAELPCAIVGKGNYAMVDGAYWSLRVELKFYLVLALCYFGISRKYYFEAFMAAVLIGGVLMFWFPGLEKNLMLPDVYLSDFLPYLPYFLGGMSIYQLRNGNWNLGAVGLAYSLTAAAIFVVLGISPLSMPTSPESFLAFAVSLALLTVFVFWFEHIGRPMGVISKGIVFVGMISYPFYLLHQDIGYIFIEVFKGEWEARYLLAPVIIGAAAYWVNRYVENLLVRRNRVPKLGPTAVSVPRNPIPRTEHDA